MEEIGYKLKQKVHMRRVFSTVRRARLWSLEKLCCFHPSPRAAWKMLGATCSDAALTTGLGLETSSGLFQLIYFVLLWSLLS